MALEVSTNSMSINQQNRNWHTTDGQEDAKKRMTATNQWMHQPINPAHPRLTNAIDKSLKLENIMNEKMSKRRIQITDLQKQEILTLEIIWQQLSIESRIRKLIKNYVKGMRFQNKQIFLLTVWTNRRNPSHKLINSNDLIVTDGPWKEIDLQIADERLND